jgi:hypothetical protein
MRSHRIARPHPGRAVREPLAAISQLRKIFAPAPSLRVVREPDPYRGSAKRLRAEDAESREYMGDMGYRDNVMGPQPIAQRKPIPEAVLETAHHILDLLASGKGAAASAMAVDSAKDEIASLAAAIKPGIYRDKSIVGTARTNQHYWIKAKLTGADAKPFTLQLRIGSSEDRWLIWEATNLSDVRSGFTK